MPYLAATVSMVIFGFSFYFTKDALTHAGMFQLLGFRFLCAAGILTVLAACGLIRLKLTKRKLAGMALIALFQPVLYFTAETVGVNLTSASESGVIIALIPIIVPLLAMAAAKGKLRLSPARWGAIALCVGGVVLIVLSKGFDGSSGHLEGVAALLGAVLAASVYTVASARVSRECTPIEVTFAMMWAGALAFNAVGVGSASAQGSLSGYLAPLADGRFLLDMLYLGVLSSIVAFFCLNYALSKLEATTVGAFENLVPVVSMFAGVVVGGERLGWLQYAGAALILIGIWGAAMRGRSVSAGPGLPAQPD